MSVVVSLYSKNDKEISRFLNSYNKERLKNNILEWKKEFQNPIEIADIIGVFIDNSENYDMTMWISLDTDFFINVTDSNGNKIIKYLFERYPY